VAVVVAVPIVTAAFEKVVAPAKVCAALPRWARVGTWASPAEGTIVNFAEGDVTRTICDTDEEFAAALREIDGWNRDHGYGPARIDPGFDPALKVAFEAVGLGDMLH